MYLDVLTLKKKKLLLCWRSRSIITSSNSYEYSKFINEDAIVSPKTQLRKSEQKCPSNLFIFASRNANLLLAEWRIFSWTARSWRKRERAATQKQGGFVNIAESSCLNIISLTRCAFSFAKPESQIPLSPRLTWRYRFKTAFLRGLK